MSKRCVDTFGVKALLHRLGFVYKKPKHIPSQFDPQGRVCKISLKTPYKNDSVIFS
ncbi:MAG: winged helix-turn-helix domain-containing protein, partial [Planctomycetaceae bacterium]|nr:winged helix-turn-helix domain-containing protein [Planctomycetaceae bacterium]